MFFCIPAVHYGLINRVFACCRQEQCPGPGGCINIPRNCGEYGAGEGSCEGYISVCSDIVCDPGLCCVGSGVSGGGGPGPGKSTV